MTAILYVYGTLRPGASEAVEIKGTMYDLGPFPGIVLGGNNTFIAERIEIETETAYDQYEGYYEDDPERSLYIRVPYQDGFIYEFNRHVDPKKVVDSGDWLKHKNIRRGHYAGRVS